MDPTGLVEGRFGLDDNQVINLVVRFSKHVF